MSLAKAAKTNRQSRAIGSNRRARSGRLKGRRRATPTATASTTATSTKPTNNQWLPSTGASPHTVARPPTASTPSGTTAPGRQRTSAIPTVRRRRAAIGAPVGFPSKCQTAASAHMTESRAAIRPTPADRPAPRHGGPRRCHYFALSCNAAKTDHSASKAAPRSSGDPELSRT